MTKFSTSSLYSVMQSDGNSFGGDVVLKSINMASSYEDQIYEKQTFSDLYYEDFTF